MIKEMLVRLANCIAAGERRLTAMYLQCFVQTFPSTYLDPYALSATYI